MIEELLKIIFEAEKLIALQHNLDQHEKIQMITSGVHELEEINDRIFQHFQEDNKR